MTLLLEGMLRNNKNRAVVRITYHAWPNSETTRCYSLCHYTLCIPVQVLGNRVSEVDNSANQIMLLNTQLVSSSLLSWC